MVQAMTSEVETVNFNGFYEALLNEHQSKFEEILSEHHAVLQNPEKIRLKMQQAICADLNKIAFRTLLTKFHLFKQDKPQISETADYYYAQFSELCKSPLFMVEMETEYPHLLTILNQRIQFYLINIQELLQHFAEDLEEIANEFTPRISFVKDIHFSLGDSHNKGKNVALVETDGGILVYKPHHLFNDLFLKDLLEFICSEMGVSMKTIQTISRDTHGWQEQIKPESYRNTQEAEQYYRNLGIQLAIFYLLKTDDIHYENIMMNRETPFILDLETIVANKKDAEQEEADTLFLEFCNEINESVMGVFILPANYKFSPFDIDLSAINNETEVSVHWKSFIIENPKSDTMQLVRKPSYIEKKQTSAMIQGELVNPYDYLESLKTGFQTCYQFLWRHQEKLEMLLDNPLYKRISSRQVLRATSLYAKLLDAVTHPHYMKDNQEVKRIFNKLIPKHAISKEEKKKITVEIEALQQHDVPYFTQPWNSRSLVIDVNTEIPNYFQKSLRSIVSERLANLSEQDLAKQLAYIDLSMLTLPRRSQTSSQVFSSVYVNDAKEIVRNRLDSQFKLTIQKAEPCTWMCHEVDGENKVKLSPISYSLYDSLGLLVNFLMYHRMTQEKKYLDYAKKGLEGVLSIYPYQSLIDNGTLSVFNGAGGYLYVLECFYNATGDTVYFDRLIELSKALKKSEHQLEEADFTSGLSGLVYLFAQLYEKHQYPVFREAAIRFGAKLKAGQEQNPTQLCGLAHGLSGVAMAFMALHKMTGQEQYLNQAKKCILKENQHFVEATSNWKDLRTEHYLQDTVYWCHGAPGIALARLSILTALKNSDETEFATAVESDLMGAVKKIMKDGFDPELGDSLCHGRYGNLDILIEINRVLKSQDIEQFIHRQSKGILSDLAAGHYRSGAASHLPIHNFMLGTYGIDHVLMRMHQPDLPSVLNLRW
ncbi:type 2 lanthipeptide synthetase LanM [Planococcus maitriensis]|uniref:type 2 lanthipeptide synthetase LanM n=1 Tax=Planococcus maitriensis TaxID=221799 RepID=UPI00142DBA75|nr:type 2 lanthipeptide synthetase LanM [Planococcus maitriensis]